MNTSLFQKILNDLQDARKTKQLEKLSVLQLVISDLKNEKIKKKDELKEDEIISVLLRQVKQLNDSIKDFESGNREDLISKAKKEIEILNSYLPEKINEKELEEIIKNIIEKVKPNGPSDFGKVMGQIMKEVKGRADGNMVQDIVKKLLV